MAEQDNGQQQSGEACPVCGRHTLQLLYFPDVGATGARPYDDILGFGDIKPDEPPAIGCASCGSEWASLDDFRAGRQLPPADPSDASELGAQQDELDDEKELDDENDSRA